MGHLLAYTGPMEEQPGFTRQIDGAAGEFPRQLAQGGTSTPFGTVIPAGALGIPFEVKIHVGGWTADAAALGSIDPLTLTHGQAGTVLADVIRDVVSKGVSEITSVHIGDDGRTTVKPRRPGRPPKLNRDRIVLDAVESAPRGKGAAAVYDALLAQMPSEVVGLSERDAKRKVAGWVRQAKRNRG